MHLTACLCQHWACAGPLNALDCTFNISFCFCLRTEADVMQKLQSPAQSSLLFQHMAMWAGGKASQAKFCTATSGSWTIRKFGDYMTMSLPNAQPLGLKRPENPCSKERGVTSFCDGKSHPLLGTTVPKDPWDKRTMDLYIVPDTCTIDMPQNSSSRTTALLLILCRRSYSKQDAEKLKRPR